MTRHGKVAMEDIHGKEYDYNYGINFLEYSEADSPYWLRIKDGGVFIIKKNTPAGKRAFGLKELYEILERFDEVID